MSKVIDCLFIGHNEIQLERYETFVREMGIHSGAYRDLNLNFIRYNNKPYSASEIFNLFYCSDKSPGAPGKPLSTGETFSAAVAYLGTYLDRRGFTFDYINSFQEQKEELRKKLTEENILSVAIITTLYVSVIPVVEIIDFVRKYNPDARVIVGGPFISTQVRTQEPVALEYLFKSVMKADIYVNSSQGEAALVNILSALKNNRSLAQVKNIYYRDNGAYRATPVLIEDNQLARNMVNWDLFTGKLGRLVNVRTSISCPFSCAFYTERKYL